MELHHLRYFVSVAQLGSFTRAAEANHVAQPSLSQQIRRLEEEIGAPLFDRSRSPIRLTDAGEALLPHAESILKQVITAQNAVAERLGLQSGRLVLGSLPMTGSRLLPAAITVFRQRYPGVQVLLREESTERLTQLALAGETDLTLTTLPVASPELAVQPLLTEEILLALPPDHPLSLATENPLALPPDQPLALPQAPPLTMAAPHPMDDSPQQPLTPSTDDRPPIPLATMADQPFLLMKPGYGFRDLCLSACRAAGFEPNIAFESAQIETLQAMVAAGLGVTLVPRMAADWGRQPAPQFRSLAGAPLTRTLALAWRREGHLSRAASAFQQVAAELWPMARFSSDFREPT